MKELIIIFMVLLIILVLISTCGGSLYNEKKTTVAQGYPSGSRESRESRESGESEQDEWGHQEQRLNPQWQENNEPQRSIVQGQYSPQYNHSIQAFDTMQSFATI